MHGWRFLNDLPRDEVSLQKYNHSFLFLKTKSKQIPIVRIDTGGFTRLL